MSLAADLQRMLTLAEWLATEAGRIAQDRLGTARPRLKADFSEVTDADVEIEAHLLEAIGRDFPRHAVVSEEGIAAGQHGDRATAEFCWVIDPLDGTRNYIRQLPVFCTSIAVMHRSLPVVAVIRSHTTGQMFTALQGGGACLDDRPVRVARQPLDRDAIIAIPTSRRHSTAPAVKVWVDQWVLRNLGSTALHMALVASGAMDAAFCQECKLWDVAAGALLVESAGGICTDLDGRPLFPRAPQRYDNEDTPFLAASAAVHAELLQSLRAECER